MRLSSNQFLLFCTASLALAITPSLADESCKSLQKMPLNEITNKIELNIEPEDVLIKGKHGVKIKIKNNTDRALIFNGENATARFHGSEYKCMNIDQFEDTCNLDLSDRDLPLIMPPVVIGGLQPAKSISSKSRSLRKSIEASENSLKKPPERFGKRILWPGDTSYGIILFNANESLTNSIIKIPASSLFDSSDQAAISNSDTH